MKLSFAAVVMAIVIAGCAKKEAAVAQVNPVPVTVKYTESVADFANPERGFYRFSQTKASKLTPLSITQLNAWKNESLAEGGNYKVYSTLIFRYYEMDIFKSQDLSAAFINSIEQDFAVARQAGFKLIPRFTYTLAQNAGNCPEGFICPPYGDAPKAVVLQHIAQLKKVLQDNADVTATVQMGFIGVWGEQYYTDFFGDASQNTTGQKLLDNNWEDRVGVLKALLDAVPKDRMIQVRYPQIKQRYVYGTNADVNAAAMTESEAFTESDKARIGFHNDCFMASSNDYGTYEDYGNSTTPRKDANTILRQFKNKDSKYVVVGGETCADAFSPQNDCEPAGRIQTELAEMHYSFLNCAYNNQVNNDWQTGGCMDNIKKNLGYRFVLKEAAFPKSAESGKSFSISINVENKGYASPYNKRPINLVLKSKDDGKVHSIILNADVRKLFSGVHSIKQEITLPADVKKGNYQLFLFMPDQYTTIANRPEYAIRLANEGVWDNATGYNNLNATLEVK
ncbi:MAG: DUF4832 domain-containing protein [Bacteroidota bacterium]